MMIHLSEIIHSNGWNQKEAAEHLGITQAELASRLSTSRSALNRLLDPTNTSINLNTLANVAQITGKRLEVRLSN